jgi:hypothetical protein
LTYLCVSRLKHFINQIQNTVHEIKSNSEHSTQNQTQHITIQQLTINKLLFLL